MSRVHLLVGTGVGVAVGLVVVVVLLLLLLFREDFIIMDDFILVMPCRRNPSCFLFLSRLASVVATLTSTISHNKEPQSRISVVSHKRAKRLQMRGGDNKMIKVFCRQVDFFRQANPHQNGVRSLEGDLHRYLEASLFVFTRR